MSAFEAFRSITGACRQTATVLLLLRQPDSFYLVSRNQNFSSAHPFRIYLYSFAIFIQRKQQLMAREHQIFLRYVCAVDLNPISCLLPSMTRWCLLSLVTGECVFEMRNCLWGMSVSQRSERKAMRRARERARVGC